MAPPNKLAVGYAYLGGFEPPNKLPPEVPPPNKLGPDEPPPNPPEAAAGSGYGYPPNYPNNDAPPAATGG